MTPLLLLVLLVVQTGALAHAYTHHATPNRQDSAASGDTRCAYCLAASPLHGPAGCPNLPQLAAPPAACIQVATPADLAIVVRPRPAFRSRAPPAFS